MHSIRSRSLRRTSDGRVFGSCLDRDLKCIVNGAVAHLGERDAGSVEVEGSIPFSSTMNEKRSIGKKYFHISNSGVIFEVFDEGHGPTISVSSSAFGNLRNNFEVNVSRECLVELAKMFSQAATEDYSREYCDKAYVIDNKVIERY